MRIALIYLLLLISIPFAIHSDVGIVPKADAQVVILKPCTSSGSASGVACTDGEFTVPCNLTVEGTAKIYFGSNSPLTKGGVDYYIPGDAATVYAIWDGATWNSTFIFDNGTTSSLIDSMNETYGNLNAYACDAFGGGPYLTIYSNSGTDSAIEDFIDSLTGTPASVVEHSWKPVFTKDANNEYTWVGTPSVCAPSVSTTWPDPPVITSSTIQLLHIESGTSTLASDAFEFSGDLFQITSGGMLFGSSVVPYLTDYLIQAFKQISNPTGNVAGLLFGFQDSSSADVNHQMWGISSGMSLYANANYNAGIKPYESSIRLDLNNHTANSITMTNSRYTTTGGAWSGTRSNTGSLVFYGCETSNEGGSLQSKVTTMTLFSDNATTPWDVTNFYGLKIQDHTSIADNSWGVYNEDRTYNKYGTWVAETTNPGSAPANQAIYWTRDNGAGKTQFCVNFATGPTQVLATQP